MYRKVNLTNNEHNENMPHCATSMFVISQKPRSVTLVRVTQASSKELLLFNSKIHVL